MGSVNGDIGQVSEDGRGVYGGIEEVADLSKKGKVKRVGEGKGVQKIDVDEAVVRLGRVKKEGSDGRFVLSDGEDGGRMGLAKGRDKGVKDIDMDVIGDRLRKGKFKKAAKGVRSDDGDGYVGREDVVRRRKREVFTKEAARRSWRYYIFT
jgi:hypothetical protein